MPAGRPSEYTPEIAEEICRRISEGQSARAVGRADDMPDLKTIYRWIGANPEFRQQYARACEDRAHLIAEQALEIADESNGDVILTEDGRPVFQGDHVQRARLRVDTRKWFAAKLAPRVYGDRMTHAGDPENPLQTVTETVDRPPNETREQWHARRAHELAARARALGATAGSAD